jgi:hypothetical protein
VNCTIIFNDALGDGGALMNVSSTVSMTGCGLANNVAEEGGGIYDVAGTSTITDGIFNNNLAAAGFAGAIYADGGQHTISDSSFAANLADQGGALYASNAVSELDGCFFEANVAWSGGALTVVDGTMSIDDCVFERNEAKDGPGGIGGAIQNRGSTTISASVFLENRAAEGGAIGNADLGTMDLTIINSVFHANTADVDGGALCNAGFGKALTMINNTFCSNVSAGAGAIANLFGADLTLRNSVLWDNASTASPFHAIENTAASSTVGHCNIEGCGESGASWDTQVGVDMGGNIDRDPRFIDPVLCNLRLGAGSPAIDAADNSMIPLSVTTDRSGHPRFVDDPAVPDTGVGVPPLADMGAYERCTGDVDGDGVVDVDDLTQLLLDWGTDGAEHHTDITGDGVVNSDDLLAALMSWMDCGA